MPGSIFFPLPSPLNKKQWFYLGVLQGVGAGVIDGGINFAIAVGMYRNQEDVKMWVFKKNTIAGDLGVTCLIQCAVSMLITSTLVHTDLHHSAITPLPFVFPHLSHLPDPQPFVSKIFGKDVPLMGEPEKIEEPPVVESRNKFVHYWLMLIRFILEGTERNMLLQRVSAKIWFGRLITTALQGLGIGVLVGFPLWCLAIVILGPIYGTRNMGGHWAPQCIKLVFAFLLGILTNPLIAVIALGSQSEQRLLLPTTQTTAPVDAPPTVSSADSSPPAVEKPLPTPATPTRRPRAFTASSISAQSFSSTGGRAQRPRAGSRASISTVYNNNVNNTTVVDSETTFGAVGAGAVGGSTSLLAPPGRNRGASVSSLTVPPSPSSFGARRSSISSNAESTRRTNLALSPTLTPASPPMIPKDSMIRSPALVFNELDAPRESVEIHAERNAAIEQKEQEESIAAKLS